LAQDKEKGCRRELHCFNNVRIIKDYLAHNVLMVIIMVVMMMIIIRWRMLVLQQKLQECGSSMF